MKIILVGNRGGKPAIYWPGVIATALIIAILCTAASAIFLLAVGWFSTPALVMAGISLPLMMVGIWVRQSLRIPVKELTVLK